MKAIIEKIQLKWMFLSGPVRFGIIAVPLLLVGAVAFSQLGLPAYRMWKESRFEAEAMRYFDKKEWSNALLSARQALLANPDNLPARRIMAELGERSGSAAAIEHRRQIARIEPTVANHLIWAESAETFRQFADMETALREAARLGADNLAYHEAAMRLATQQGDAVRFQKHLEKVSTLDPENRRALLNREILRMVAGTPEESARGRRNVETMMWDPDLRSPALHALATRAVENGDFAEAFLYATWLRDEPDLRFDDRLLILNILRQAPGGGWRDFLEDTQRNYGRNPLSAVVLAGWLIDHGFARETADWLSELLRREDPWPALYHPRARALARLEEWSRLEEILRGENWQQNEFLRYAFMALTQENMNRPGGAADSWQQAQLFARSQPDALLNLARAAGGWGWDQRAAEVYWRYLERNPPDDHVFNALFSIHLRLGDSDSILRLAEKRLTHRPEDPLAANASAMLRLLRDTDVEAAALLARQNLEAHPRSPMMITTLALAHYRKGDAREALRLQETLTEESLRGGNIPLYHALFLQATGQNGKARAVLDGWQGHNLLPEEKEIRETLTREIARFAAARS